MTDDGRDPELLKRQALELVAQREFVNAAAKGEPAIIVFCPEDVVEAQKIGLAAAEWPDPQPDVETLRALEGKGIMLWAAKSKAGAIRNVEAGRALQSVGAQVKLLDGRSNAETFSEALQRGHELKDAVEHPLAVAELRAGLGGDLEQPSRVVTNERDHPIDDDPARAGWTTERPHVAGGNRTHVGEQPETPLPDLFTGRMKRGGRFVLDDPSELDAVWGQGDQVLWSTGEPLLVVGPTGVGKTTVALQLLAGRLGILGEFLGYPIARSERPTLYLAMDRPRQIRRAMLRIFGEQHRQTLDELLLVWEGPLPLDLGKAPTALLELVREVDAGTVIIDSLKDACVKLTEDESGGNYNRAIQHVIADEREVLGLHHQRKGQGGARPNTLEDVYGSTWITAGAGSVLLLWGAAGDPIVGVKHLKQPAAEIGPLKIEHDHLTGRSSIYRGVADPPLVLKNNHANGIDASGLARVMFEVDKPNDLQRKKAERSLDRLVKDGFAYRSDCSRAADGTMSGRRYYITDQEAK